MPLAKFRFTSRKLLLSLGAGLLCLALSNQGISVQFEDVKINLVWSVIFPVLISLVYGSTYGIIAGFAGAALFPFFLWSNNGYANFITFISLQLFYFLAGQVKPTRYIFDFPRIFMRMAVIMGIFTVVNVLGYLFLFEKALSFNPPVWAPDALNYIHPAVLRGLLIKTTISYTFMLLFAELLIHLPIVRQILQLPNHTRFRLNYKLFFLSILTAIIIWLLFISLDLVLFDSSSAHGYKYYVLILTVMFWSSIIVARTLISMIEKRLESENNFRQREEEFRSIFESLHAGIGIIDTDGKYKFSNRWWQKKLGYSESEMNNLRNIDITHPDDLTETIEKVNQLVDQSVTNFSFEKRYIKKTGEVFWGELYVSGIKDENGQISLLAGIINDITYRKNAEGALLREKLFSSRVIEALPGIFYLYTYPDLRLVLWNTNHEKLLGYDSGEMRNRHISEWQPERSYIKVIAAVEKAMTSGQNMIESSLTCKDGSEIPFLMTGVRFETEKQLYLLGFGIDLRDKRKAEDELKATQERQNAMIANISDVIAIIDKNGINRYKSPNVEKWFGWKQEELIGKSSMENVHPEDLEAIQNFFNELIIQDGKSGVTECRYKCKNGDYKWIEVFAINCIDSSLINGILINYKDNSEQKKNLLLQQEVIIARKSAEFKQKFLANMSHEIRTPLTGVMGMAEILSQTKLDLSQQEYLNTLIQSGENLKEIINLILDYSKIEAGKITLKNAVLSLNSLATDTESFFKSINHKAINWQSSIDHSLPPYILSDKQRINQVIRNLVSNAVKFTDSGFVKLKISANPQPSALIIKPYISVMVEVIDSGRGIHTCLQNKLFEPFYQAENDNTRIQDGTGLGLAICKELAHILGGEIGFASTPGEGSRFWFTFTCKESNNALYIDNADSSTLGKLKPINILLVEDKKINQKVITLLLQSAGHVVTVAENGEDALRIFQPGLYNLILMDIQMPVMDGITATSSLRNQYSDLPPIVGLSANAFEGDREKYMNLGLDEYLTKPINMPEFTRIIANLNL
jgi:PAS domain S-box-containing protein